MTRRLLYCGFAAGPLFVLAFLIEGALKSDGYDVLRHPVSSLALGEHGWTQTANFLLCGMLTILFAAGLWQSEPWVDVAGLFQRLTVIIGWTWTVALAVRVRSRLSNPVAVG